MSDNNTQDFIDLAKIGAALSRFINRNLRLFIIATVLAAGVGFAKYKIDRKVYRTTMILDSPFLADVWMQQYFDVLVKLQEENEYKQLAQKLGLTDDEALLIDGIAIEGAATIRRKMGTQIEVQEQDGSVVEIEVDVFDNNVLPKLQAGIINYLGNNELAQRNYQAFRHYAFKGISETDKQLRALDSINGEFFTKFLINGKVNATVLNNPGDYHLNKNGLTDFKFKQERQLEELAPMRVIKPFTPFAKPVKPKLLINLIIFGVGFNMLAFIYALARR